MILLTPALYMYLGTWALGVRTAADQGHGWPIRMDVPRDRGDIGLRGLSAARRVHGRTDGVDGDAERLAARGARQELRPIVLKSLLYV